MAFLAFIYSFLNNLQMLSGNMNRPKPTVFLGNLAVRVPLGKSYSYNCFFKIRRQGRL